VNAKLAQLPDVVKEKQDKMWTTFKVDAEGPYLESRCIKAMFKEGANILKETLISAEKKGDKDATKSRYVNFKSKLAEKLQVDDYIIPFMREGKRIPKVDGSMERAIQVMTMQGPRSALKNVDYIEAPASLTFNIRWLDEGPRGPMNTEVIAKILEFAQHNGTGSDRSQNFGKFSVVSLMEIEAKGKPIPQWIRLPKKIKADPTPVAQVKNGKPVTA
jgi:hypothetical protein